MIHTKIATALLSAIMILLSKDKSFSVSGKGMMYSVAFSAFTSIGNLLLLIALLHLPASVQYPVVTGGVIVFSTVIDGFRREKVTKKQILSAVVAFGATVLMIL